MARGGRQPAAAPATRAATALPAAGSEALVGVSKPEASSEQFAAYIEAQFHAHRGITEATALLETRFKLTGDPAERREITPKIAEYQSLLQDMEADRTAFMAEALVVRPPSEAEVTDLKRIADRLDNLIAASETATEIIKLATQIAQTWNRTKAGAAPAGTGDGTS